ncbi:hypothetical protein [Clostridium tetani]|uniref:Uncharacterized protein n=1 Tax=Clostridium tetani TaxID=1513 RepID=A0ABY0EQP4_CLOTA|nr:hypothetical protein [Clostridium tetani]RXI57403.1 hypothetical protein DP131_05225 [Clostridium tetani]RXI66981.1 hypothetical protein DQN76_12610 [Clostridium tetani]
MLNIDESVNMYGNVEREGKKILTLNANFNLNRAFNVSVSILDEESVKKDKENIQKQVDEFIKNVKEKASELGYEITV